MRDVHKVHFDIFKREFKCLLNHGSNEKCSMEHGSAENDSINSIDPLVFPWSTQEEMSANSSDMDSSNTTPAPNLLNSNPTSSNSSAPQSSLQSQNMVSVQSEESSPNRTLQPQAIATNNIEAMQENTETDETSENNIIDEADENHDDRLPEPDENQTDEDHGNDAFGWQHSSAKNTFPTISLLENSNASPSTSDVAFGWKHLSAKNYDLPGQCNTHGPRQEKTGNPFVRPGPPPPGRVWPPIRPEHITPRLLRPNKYSEEYFLGERSDGRIRWPSAERLAQLHVGSLDPALNYDLRMERYQLNEDQEKSLLAIINDPATILNPKNFFMFKVTVKDAPRKNSKGNGSMTVDKYGLMKKNTEKSTKFCPMSASFTFEELKTKKPDPKTGQRLHPNEIKQNYKIIYKAHHRFRRSLCNWRLAWLYHVQQHHETDGQVKCFVCDLKLGLGFKEN